MSVDPVLIVSILFSRPHSKFLVSYQSGAGPSGLVLALTLRKNHIDVCIIDKEPGPRLGERAAGVSVSSFTSFSHYQLAMYISSLARSSCARSWGRSTMSTAHAGQSESGEYDPLDGHNVVSEYMVPTSETTVGTPYVCARTVSSLA